MGDKLMYVDWDIRPTQEDVIWGDTVEELREEFEKRGLEFDKDYVYEVKKYIEFDGGYAVYTDADDTEAIVVETDDLGEVFWGELYKVVGVKSDFVDDIEEGSIAVETRDGDLLIYGGTWRGQSWFGDWTEDEAKFKEGDEILLLQPLDEV